MKLNPNKSKIVLLEIMFFTESKLFKKFLRDPITNRTNKPLKCFFIKKIKSLFETFGSREALSLCLRFLHLTPRVSSAQVFS